MLFVLQKKDMYMVNKFVTIKPAYLSVISGLLLWAAWPPSYLFVLLFVGFVPLFLLEEKVENNKQYYWLVYLSLFLWNVLTTYWIWNATPIGALAWILNTFIMTLPWAMYRKVKKTINQRVGLICFVGLWLGIEYLHLNWEIAWPWLNLGNGFAMFPNVIQWYEFTGTGGGTLWVLLVNILFFIALKHSWTFKKTVFSAFAILLIPMSFSLAILLLTVPRITKDATVNFTIYQPNDNPYEQNTLAYNQEKLNKIASFIEHIEEPTDFIVLPEGALPSHVWEHELDSSPEIILIKNALQTQAEQGRPASVIIGADVLHSFSETESIPSTARYHSTQDFYFDVYNAALFIHPDSITQIAVKSKLVPGVERMPYPSYLKPLQNFNIDLGGIAGTRAMRDEDKVFSYILSNDASMATVGVGVCYESVFGDHMNDFVKNGAKTLVIITNDGWWKNTPGYKQHLHYARLRAIETRTTIARSANTGISAFINAKGSIVSQTNWWEETSLSASFHQSDELTVYTKYGDVIYRAGALVAMFLLLLSIVKEKTNHFKYRV